MKPEPLFFRIGDLVLYRNNQLIAFNKPATLPVLSDKTQDKPLLALAEIYCHTRLYPVHRIDRPASGIVLFARTKQAASALNEQFQNRSIRKTYLAVVSELPATPEGTLIHFLEKNTQQNRSIAYPDERPNALRAELHYRHLDSIDRYHLLEIELLTGRHHQIRAQLAAIGCPIKGDDKYGAKRGNRDRSIHLHAWKLAFDHPVSGEREEIVAPIPEEKVWQAFSWQ